MEAILVTTTEGHMRLERARERFAQFAEEPSVMESHRKRHRPEGEGRQPLAPPAPTALESGVYQEGGGTGSGLPLSRDRRLPRGGPVTLDLTMWDFNRADCRTKFRKLVKIRHRLY